MLSNHPKPTDLIVFGRTWMWGQFGNLWCVRKVPYDFAMDFACVQNTVVNRLL